MRTGTSAPRLRISLTISKPFRPGSITSRMTRSTLLSRARANPSSPSWARITSCPSLRRLTRRPSAMARSSSMTRTRPIPGRCNAIRSGGGGQLDAEGGAFSLLALDLDAAAVGLDDALGDGEPQAGAFGVAGEQVVGAIEALEDALALVGADADAVVGHLDGDRSVAPAPAAQPDALVGTGVLDRVVEQVEDRLSHRVAVDRDLGEPRIELGLVGGPELLGAEDFLDVIEEAAQVGGPSGLRATTVARPDGGATSSRRRRKVASGGGGAAGASMRKTPRSLLGKRAAARRGTSAATARRSIWAAMTRSEAVWTTA